MGISGDMELSKARGKLVVIGGCEDREESGSSKKRRKDRASAG
jgi:hypothetical protein